MIARDTKGRVKLGWFEWVVQILIVLSLVAFAVETLPDLDEGWQKALRHFEVFSVSVFTVEFLLRLCLARPFTAYGLSFFGIIDLLSILPFYLAIGADLRSLRAFRLLRLFRAFKLARHNSAMNRFQRALKIAKEELVLFGAITLVLIYLAAVGIYYFENPAQPDHFRSVFDSLWWAVTTLTTVGYGDIYPITAGGRFFTFLILVVGLGIVAVPTGIFSAALSKARDEEDERRKERDPHRTDLKDHENGPDDAGDNPE